MKTKPTKPGVKKAKKRIEEFDAAIKRLNAKAQGERILMKYRLNKAQAQLRAAAQFYEAAIKKLEEEILENRIEEPL
jgi:hypothetical protein